MTFVTIYPSLAHPLAVAAHVLGQAVGAPVVGTLTGAFGAVPAFVACAVVGLVICWFMLTQVLFRPEIKEIPGGRELIRHEMQKLGRMSRGEMRVLVIFVLAAAAWIGVPLIWGKDAPISDAGIAIAVGELVDDAVVDVENIFRRLRENAKAGHPHSVFDVVVREALGPLILGYTYVLIAIVDMTAIAGAIGGGGLGQFAITYGYQKLDWSVTLVAVVTIIILVQFAQFLGNWLARRALRR